MKFVIDDRPNTSPDRPRVRAGIVRAFNAYAVPGVATVEAWPHRSLSHARAIARRLHKHPTDYAAVIQLYQVPGVTFDAAANTLAARRVPTFFDPSTTRRSRTWNNPHHPRSELMTPDSSPPSPASASASARS